MKNKFEQICEELEILFEIEGDPTEDEVDPLATDDETEEETPEDTEEDPLDTPEEETPEDETDTPEEEEPVNPPEERDMEEIETEVKVQNRIDDFSDKITDELLKIAQERFDAFRKALNKRGIDSVVDDFLSNYFAKKTGTKIDGLFIDLYSGEIRVAVVDKLKNKLTLMSLGGEDDESVEEEPVPEMEEEERLWLP